MAPRILVLFAVLALAATAQAFMPTPTFVGSKLASASTSSTAMNACRVNAKKEKRQRNRENMRKFQKKRGASRRKMMKKVQSNAQRQLENEFISKCFTTIPPPEEPQQRDDRRGARR
mmetsp:Transcript_45776/g.67574  ORF Transcript_45776/g.67574 Transcript_45776/m.67574 type:complete len:117 (+) Transcript_45776:103-453(+)|eukprot:CAMPEP_0195518794 /NCGR_PEP_ID=MMETSP0794_2-20130614/13679_1 /TAXON_ID=515487 /ORGANISM="Stephanopyxis turris, Strain CCMP 815" /LENGTH=116 /DNA_ID=CAMNT_0040647819 /DNA_START=103 /DNA_END=453 /DNA_ORIENTATION=+